MIWGDSRLTLAEGATRHGVGMAVFRCLDGRWLIVHDHRSYVDAPAAPR